MVSNTPARRYARKLTPWSFPRRGTLGPRDPGEGKKVPMKTTLSNLMELMGSTTTEAEAEAMQEILDERSLDPDEMSDSDFFCPDPTRY